MKIWIAFAIVSLGSTLAGFVQDNSRKGKMEDVVKGLDQELSAAILRGDASSVEAILADDYIEISSQGSVRTKTHVMELVRARAKAPRSQSIGPELTIEEASLKTYGDVAIFTGVKKTRYQHMQYHVSPEPGPSAAPTVDRERFMKVFIKKGGRWQLVSSQTTPVLKPRP
jgi:ketosteroid isomerase-like protein